MAVNKAFNILVLLALIMGGVSLFLIKVYVDGIRKEAAARAPAKEQKVEMSKVMLALVDIPPASELKTNMFEFKEVPKLFVAADALTSEEQLKGRVTAQFLPKGDIIMDSKLAPIERIKRASYQLGEGRRLVTIRVDETKGNAYLIKNGDRVDLVWTTDVEGFRPGRGASVTQTILQGIKVFDIQHGNEAQAYNPQEGEAPVAQGARLGRGTTATLDVTPEEVEIIINAEMNGTLALILRPYEDDKNVDSKGFSSIELEDRVKPQQVVEEPKPEPVVVPVQPAPTPKRFY